MRKITFFIAGLFAAINVAFISSCNQNNATNQQSDSVSVVSVRDTAVYGICDSATTMNVLHLITDDNKKMEIIVDPDSSVDVLGGLYTGDRVMLTYHKTSEGILADKVVNLSSLFGRWTSLDRNFVILDDGNVESTVSAESNPYTAWSTVNANLILNADTFSILSLGADSLALENDKGIFVYKRQK